MKIALKKESGEILEHIFDLAQVSIGRSNKCDFVVVDESLSRQHCMVEFYDGEFYVTDLGSSNGVFIDGDRIPANTRVLYKNFNSLSLGIFDCSIQDSNGSQDAPHYRAERKTTPGTEDATVVRTSIPLDKKKTQKQTPVNKFQLWILPLAVLGFAVFYYMNTEREVENTVIIPTKVANNAPSYKSNVQLLKEMPNEFKSAAEYIEEEKQKTCTGDWEKTCTKMKLNPIQEGFFQKGKDLTIYLEPALYEKELRYRGVDQLADKLDLIVMDKVLGSDPMTDYFLEQNLHIHLAIKNSSGVITKIIRFHPMLYSSATANRLDALRLLEGTFQSLNSQNFWAHLKPYLAVFEMPTP